MPAVSKLTTQRTSISQRGSRDCLLAPQSMRDGLRHMPKLRSPLLAHYAFQTQRLTMVSLLIPRMSRNPVRLQPSTCLNDPEHRLLTSKALVLLGHKLAINPNLQTPHIGFVMVATRPVTAVRPCRTRTGETCRGIYSIICDQSLGFPVLGQFLCVPFLWGTI
eukprot:5853463-Amphidinium_carterae.1